MRSFEVLGVRVDDVDHDAALARIERLAAGDTPALVVTLGVEMVMAARRDPAFRAVVNRAALVTCDTIGILLASRVRGGPLRARVTGVELVPALAARSASNPGVRLYLLGGGGDTAARAARALTMRYPGATIAGARDGYFTESELPAVVGAIRASGATVLCAGLGSPKQELWLDRHLAETGCRVGIGVGGTFDVLAGNVARAPAVVTRAGLEWLYRLVREPRRWRRQLALPAFALAAGAEALSAVVRGKRDHR